MQRLLVILTALGATLLSLPSVRGEDEILRIETTYLQAANHRPDRQDPADRLASPQPLEFDLGLEPAPGTGRVPPGREHLYGQLDLGTRQVPLVLAVQADGLDAVLDLGGAEVRERGRESESRGRKVVRWTFSALSLGAARVDVAIHRTAADRQAVLVRGEEPAPIALAATPRTGCRLFAPDTPVVGHGEVDGIGVAFARGEGQRLTLLYDRNGNGVVGESGEVLPLPVAGRDGDATYWQAESVSFPGGPAGVAFQEIPGEVVGYARPSGARRGRTRVGEVVYSLHLLDADLDGRYGSDGDRWWFGPVDRLPRIRRLTPDAMVEANEPVFLDGRGWRLVSVDASGGAVVMPDPNAGTVGDYFHRRAERVNRERWWDVFRAEEGAFRAEHGIDPVRPKTGKIPHWIHDVDLSRALAEARRQDKPLLVDFEADWCSWCKRFDYYVYVDREVADLLEGFVLLKINKEFHFTGDFDRLGGKGLPFLVFLRPDGTKLLDGPPGFQPPAEFAATLRAALAAWRR